MIVPALPVECIVPSECGGRRLDVFLSGVAGGVSRSRLQKLIAGGGVLVNGSVARKNHRVSGGEMVRMAGLDLIDPPRELGAENLPLSVLYEDGSCLAVDKASGVVVHPGNGNRTGTLVNALLYHLGRNLSEGSLPERPGIVHRLDKGTSGVLLIAKTNAAHAALARAFARREVKKEYLGFCLGVPSEAAGTIDIPLARSRKDPLKRAPDRRGKISVTEFSLLAARSGVALVKFMPRTGRTHQIRVHCSNRGFPILADSLYGGGSGRLPQISPEFRPFAARMLGCFARHALHAWRITFPHPVSNEPITVEAPLPDDFRRALAEMGETCQLKNILA
jgi:23S rRNA pseudouridine1911/1915/1917 synthase